MIVDQFGVPLPGTDPSATHFGEPYVKGDIVQILLATDGIIHPPGIDGTPDANNIVLLETRIGCGTLPGPHSEGRFSVALSPRPAGSSLIFARVFNNAYMPDASFYGDSQLFTVSSTANDVFMVDLLVTGRPLDPADSDGDGLNNSLEKAYGSNPYKADTDDDGMSDLEEAVAGTVSTEPYSLLEVLDILPSDTDGVVVRWGSVPGRTYHVQYSSDLSQGQAGFEDAGYITATDSLCELRVAQGTINKAETVRVVVRGSP